MNGDNLCSNRRMVEKEKAERLPTPTWKKTKQLKIDEGKNIWQGYFKKSNPWI